MVYRVFVTKEVVDADSWDEACEVALNDDFKAIQVDEYLDDERNSEVSHEVD